MLPLSTLLSLSEQQFRELFVGTPVRRAGYNKFIRNCLIAAGNAADRTLIPTILKFLDHETLHVQVMAIWALHQLCEEKTFQELKREWYDPHEALAAEWNAN